jgi:hypothetical protein
MPGISAPSTSVDDVDGAPDAAKWARVILQWAAAAASIWGINGINYRKTFNDNMLVVFMIETPTGVANAYDLESVAGIDVVIIGNNDLSSFSEFPQNDDRYQATVTKVHDDTLIAGKIFGQANANYYKGHPLSNDSKFFRNGLPLGGWALPGRGGRNATAPPPDEDLVECAGHFVSARGRILRRTSV